MFCCFRRATWSWDNCTIFPASFTMKLPSPSIRKLLLSSL